MNVLPTPLPGVLIVEPRVFADARGFFLETFQARRFAEHGLPTEFPQDNYSRSVRGVLRGLHYQLRQPQGKLVSVVRGEVYDVAVDLRRGSPTFGQWFGMVLAEEPRRFLWIPPGFAHGFCVLSDVADLVYKCTALYAPDDERGIIWSDPTLAIDWPIESPLLSPKDAALPVLTDGSEDLPAYSVGAAV